MTTENEAEDESSSGEASKQAKQAKAEAEVLSRPVVTIVVLGDIGRSPRMRFHAMSLAKQGFFVHMIGYGGSALPKELEENKSIWISTMTEPPAAIQSLPRLMAYPIKVVLQWLFLAWTFMLITYKYGFIPDFIMVQNPPSVPTLPLTWIYSKIYRCPLVVDWHNYGYSLMALNFRTESLVTRLYKWIETYFGAKGKYHICVTDAMRDDLKKRFGINAITFHDRPPQQFRSLDGPERNSMLQKLSLKYPTIMSILEPKEGEIPPGILVSSTSWTEDENFSILLTALAEYDAIRRSCPQTHPKLIVFITGKGPQKEYYQRIINKLDLKEVEIHLPWLEPEDYPRILGCADLGVSLHTSSSGLDLPMKVVDMFGCGLPVAAIHFPCISELVRHMHNGLVFRDSTELAQQIQDWFKLKPTLINKNREKFRKNLQQFQSLRWHESWVQIVDPIFRS